MRSVSHKIAAATTKCVVEENTRKQEIDGNWTNPPLQNVSARRWLHQICLYKMLTGKSLDSESNDPESTTKCFLKKYDDTVLLKNLYTLTNWRSLSHTIVQIGAPKPFCTAHKSNSSVWKISTPIHLVICKASLSQIAARLIRAQKKYPNRGTNRG